MGGESGGKSCMEDGVKTVEVSVKGGGGGGEGGMGGVEGGGLEVSGMKEVSAVGHKGWRA
uniref:30S ribosomal protein S11 n=1 Tax=Cytobacillus oceanisediminis TaxID=665099 RepID=UPI0011A776AB